MMIWWLVDRSSRLPTAVGFPVREQRNENGRFLFSPMRYPIQQGLAYLFRSGCVDAESEGGYRFKAVNLHAAFVRYADSPSYPVFPQDSAFAECLYPRPNRRGDNPEQFADFPLGHGGCAYIGRQGDIALPVRRDDIPFFFHRYAVFKVLKWPGRYSSPCPPACATGFPCPDLSFGR